VERFYRERGCRLAWFSGPLPSQQAHAVASMLRRADRKGLPPEDYDGLAWENRLASLAGAGRVGSDAERVRLDVALTAASLQYVSDLHAGRVDPRRRLGFDLRRRPGAHEAPAVLLERVVAADDVRAAIEAVEPPFPAYRRAVRALEAYLEMAREGDEEPLPLPRSVVAPGDAFPGVPLLSRRLRRLGDLPAAELLPGDLYDGALVDAARRFPRRQGLAPDGRLDARTIGALIRPLARRVAQLQLTLERWRWLPRDVHRPPIVVNLPEFRLHAGDAGQRWSTKVVVGKAYQHRTPVLASELKSVIFRPAWKVPLQIQRKELVAQVRKKPAVLVRDGYEIVDPRGQSVDTAGRSLDETLDLLSSGALRLRQRPGPRNALGLVKFSFPNEYDVYLHDTPTRKLFSRSRRDLSHGCIRVEEPVRLAEWALRDRPEWTRERIVEAMNGARPVQVNLVRPIPIFILYATAVVTEDGTVQFFEDIYRHDEELERALASKSLPAG
jgi:murein L,D-transpeptidase YcbB/YkuD